ncbi:MAG: aldehyde dehydrogenase family protein, partial [Hungatella sp.]
MTLTEMGFHAKEVSTLLNTLGSLQKNQGLRAAAKSLLDGREEILAANQTDVKKAVASGMNSGLVDRLELSDSRIQAIADGLLQVAELEDPVGEVISMKPRPNGLLIGQKRVPLGVVGLIYEARPNVTADAFGLCFKTGNAVILKGGSDALESNRAIVHRIQAGLQAVGLPPGAVQLLETSDRKTTEEFMRMNQYVDVLIPRGGAGLIKSVV